MTMKNDNDKAMEIILAAADSLRAQFNTLSGAPDAIAKPLNASTAMSCMEQMMEVTVAMAMQMKRIEEEKKALEARVEELETPQKVNLSKSGPAPGPK